MKAIKFFIGLLVILTIGYSRLPDILSGDDLVPACDEFCFELCGPPGEEPCIMTYCVTEEAASEGDYEGEHVICYGGGTIPPIVN